MSRKFRTNINFTISNSLIYYIAKEQFRLCILKTLEKEIFQVVHNYNYYVDIYRYFIKVIETLFISRLLQKIRIYIEYCSTC